MFFCVCCQISLNLRFCLCSSACCQVCYHSGKDSIFQFVMCGQTPPLFNLRNAEFLKFGSILRFGDTLERERERETENGL
jgi:hypothetical protein